MLTTLKNNLVLEFITGYDEQDDEILSKVTISDLRDGLTSSQIWQVVEVFSSLIKYELSDAYVVTTKLISA